MKAITFLGASRAYDTTYVMPDGREHTARYFGAALARFYPDLDMQVFVTAKAKETHLADFDQLTEDYVATLTSIDIPDGADEAELWTVFQRVIDAVDQKEAVIFDITHGFRSLPFLSFLAAAYLRVVKEVDLKAVLYGNFEARDQRVDPNRAPVFDLTPFVSLLDWMTAADRFVRFGDGRDLAARLEGTRPDFQEDPVERRVWERSGIGLAKATLVDLSQAMRLIRPEEAMVASDRLRTRMKDAMDGIETFARPLQPLTQQIVDGYAPLALAQGQLDSDPVRALAVEREMVHWYLKRQQSVQAVAVAREWIVTWGMLHVGLTQTNDRGQRSLVEQAFGVELQRRQKSTAASTPVHERLMQAPNVDDAVAAYGQLGNLRNDLLHAAKRADAMPGRSLAKNAPAFCLKIDMLPLPQSLELYQP